MPSLDEQLQDLENMSGPELRSRWQRLLKAEPPRLSPELMRLAIAYRLQERKLGGVPPGLARELRSSASSKPQTKLKPGTRLVRSWNGRTIDVLVTPDGYGHDRRTYRSLSHIAREVTGTSWSGPRFFGLPFVSITQAFNTTTSMGRLTLNVLLSFAQFEGEVISERVRDKMAASRKKGMWMGGSPALGYDVGDRKLVINEAEAETVRHIMRRYVALGCGRLLLDELRRERIITKRRPDRGGVSFGRGSLFYFLTNRLYLGEVRHHGTWYPGEHEPIVDQELWDTVQEMIRQNRVSPTRRQTIQAPSLLAGLLFDAAGRRMVPSHANKSGQRYRYYVTSADLVNDAEPAYRLPAHDLEEAVRSRLRSFLISKTELRRELMVQEATELRRIATILAAEARELKLTDRVRALIQRVDLNREAIVIAVKRDPLLALIGAGADDMDAPIILTAPAVHGKEIRLLLHEPGSETAARNPHLVALLKEAAEARALIHPSANLSISKIAAGAGRCRS